MNHILLLNRAAEYEEERSSEGGWSCHRSPNMVIIAVSLIVAGAKLANRQVVVEHNE
jgi:hypothetical protein